MVAVASSNTRIAGAASPASSSLSLSSSRRRRRRTVMATAAMAAAAALGLLLAIPQASAASASSMAARRAVGGWRRGGNSGLVLAMTAAPAGAAAPGAAASVAAAAAAASRGNQQRRSSPSLRRPSSGAGGVEQLTGVRGGGGGNNGGWETVVEGLKNGCASGMAAACAKLLLQPFDTVKTLQQATKGSLSMAEAARDLVRRKGVGALYTGLGVTLVGSIPAVSVYFGVYQAAKKAMLQSLPPGLGWSLLGVAASAAIGNTVASVFRVPYEVVKQRLQAGMYGGSTRLALRTMYREEGGVGAFFGRGGVASQIMRDVPYAIVTLLTYESLRRARAELRKDGSPSTPFEDSMIGALAGGVGSLISNPMDVVKTRIMTQPQLYSSVAGTVSKVWAEEGAAAFFKGTAPRLLHKVPANAIFFATYELFRQILRVHG